MQTGLVLSPSDAFSIGAWLMKNAVEAGFTPPTPPKRRYAVMNSLMNITQWGSARDSDNKWWLRVRDLGAGSAELLDIRPESEITQTIANWWGHQSFAIRTLGKAVDSLKNSIEYNSVYNAYLLDQLTEDEFEQQSLDFVSCNF